MRGMPLAKCGTGRMWDHHTGTTLVTQTTQCFWRRNYRLETPVSSVGRMKQCHVGDIRHHHHRHCAVVVSTSLSECLGMLFPDPHVLRYPLPDGALPELV